MRLAPLAALLALSACASPSPGPAPGPMRHPTRAEAPPPTTPHPPGPLSMAALPGWLQEDHFAAFQAFSQTCNRDPTIATACAESKTAPVQDRESARRFFEERFGAVLVANDRDGPGLLTAYFSPEYQARTVPDEIYSGLLRPRPADLQMVDGALMDPPQPGRRIGARMENGRPVPYFTRGQIEAQAGEALAYLTPEDLFFLQIQGSGTLVFPDGSRRRAVYAGDNGRPFVGIARVMRERGLLADNQTSGDAIRTWLARNRGSAAQAVMNENTRYVFFALQPDDGREPAGAAGVSLPAGRAIAIDPTRHAYGQFFWIDGVAPALAGAFPTYRRLVAALDTGGAIKGPVRADLYLGRGDAAGAEAGRVRHDLRMFRIVPR